MQPGEERRVLEGLLDERVHVLFERQVHPDADALHPWVCLRHPCPFVGGAVLRELPTAHVGSRTRAYHLICHADDARANFAGRSSSRSPIVMSMCVVPQQQTERVARSRSPRLAAMP